MQGMRDLLRKTLRESLRAMSPEDRLAAAWPVACGRTMAGRGTVAGFADGVLCIQVTDPAWLAQMRAMGSVLQHDLARVAGVPVSAIHFELKATPSR